MTTSRASLLLESITDPVVSFDARWRYTYVNAAAESFLNRGRESLLGQVCWEVFPHWHEQENARWVRRAMAERRTVVWEACSTPARVWMQWRCYPLEDGGVSVVAQNIDERVRAAAALQSDADLLKRAAAADLVRAIRALASGDVYLDPKPDAVLGPASKAASPRRVAAPLELSDREAAVLRMIALGYSMKRMAEALGLSPRTLETYKNRGMAKLALENRADIVRFALQQGWLKDA